MPEKKEKKSGGCWWITMNFSKEFVIIANSLFKLRINKYY